MPSKKTKLGFEYTCQNCKKERETTCSRELYSKNFVGPCGDSFCYGSCDMSSCRPTHVKICDACTRKLSHPKFLPKHLAVVR